MLYRQKLETLTVVEDRDDIEEVEIEDTKVDEDEDQEDDIDEDVLLVVDDTEVDELDDQKDLHRVDENQEGETHMVGRNSPHL